MNIMLKLLQWLFGKDNGNKNDDRYDKVAIKDTLNLQPDQKDKRDFKVRTMLKAADLPKQTDLRAFDTEIKNQANLGACTGFAFGSAYETMRHVMSNNVKYNQGDEWNVSELFIYYNERDLMGTINRDTGAYMRDGCKALYKWGASLELFWPYVVSKFREKPGWMSYFAGRWTRIKGYYRCFNNNDIKLALSKGMPVVFGMQVYSNYFSYRGNVYKNKGGSYAGGHAQVLVGYDDAKNAFLVRNSWGKNWGERGYCWIDYNLFNQLSFDHWVIIPYGWKE